MPRNINNLAEQYLAIMRARRQRDEELREAQREARERLAEQNALMGDYVLLPQEEEEEQEQEQEQGREREASWFDRFLSTRFSPQEAALVTDNSLFNLGLNYTFENFSEANPFFGLLLRNALRGGVGAALSGDPITGASIGIKGAFKELPGVIENAIRRSRRKDAEQNDVGFQIVNEPAASTLKRNPDGSYEEFVDDLPYETEDKLEKLKNIYDLLQGQVNNSSELSIDRQNVEGEDVEAARERLAKQSEKGEQLANPVNAYRDLVMQRIINFTIPGRNGLQSNKKSQGVKILDFLRKKNSLSTGLLQSLV